jgi:hypothetical protein
MRSTLCSTVLLSLITLTAAAMEAAPVSGAPGDDAALVRMNAAISAGVPLYNEGDHAACAEVYQTATTELAGLELRPWHERQVSVAQTTAPEAATERAWHFRRLFDSISADLTFSPVKEASLPEGFPEHGPIGMVVRKDYPPYRMAMSTGGMAFGRLFRHIQKRGIPMTAPVEMARTDEGSFMMGFMYENPEQGAAGEQDNITVVDIGERAVLSIALRGQRSQDTLAEAQEVIRAYAETEGIAISDDWRMFGYSSPMIPRDRQYFEIQVTLADGEAGAVSPAQDPVSAEF